MKIVVGTKLNVVFSSSLPEIVLAGVHTGKRIYPGPHNPVKKEGSDGVLRVKELRHQEYK
jgi:hypothetical protein